MPVDPNVFNNIHNYQDYNMANQDFMARQQAANLAAQQQGNVLKGQALYAAAQTADPTTWQATLQKLNANGIDTSDVPQDVASGAKYAEGLRLAQSPLGSLLGAASKLDANANTAQTAAGQVPAGGGNAIAAALLSGGGINPNAGVRTVQPLQANAITAAQAKTMAPGTFTGNGSAPLVSNAPIATTNNFTDAMKSGGAQILSDMGGSSVPAQTQPLPGTIPSAPQFVPPSLDPSKTLAANQAAYQQALDAFNTNNKAALAGSVTTAEENAKKGVLQETGAIGSKDILRLYSKLGKEAPNVPGGVAGNLWADVTNAANSPSQGAINRGAYDADLNNLYLATIRSLAGTGRVQKAELDKIAQAAPSNNDSPEVKISKANAHLEDYNQRMIDLGFNPTSGQRLAPGEQPQLIPPVPTPGKARTISNAATLTTPSGISYTVTPGTR